MSPTTSAECRVPRLRACVTAAPRYRPGARSVARPSGPIVVKLSSNESPYQPLPGVLSAAVSAAQELNRYPDLSAAALVDALAARYDVSGEQLAVGTGSVALLHQVVHCTAGPGQEVVYAWRSFEAYPIAVALADATPVPVPLTPDQRHDLVAMADAITERTRLVLLCSPNNPTGVTITEREARAFLDRVPANVLVVLDEAYAEFVTSPGAVRGPALLRDYPNLCLLRTFSKAYGLAGLRIGYALAPSEVAQALRTSAVPFGVSAMAQAAALASLGAEAALAERVAALVAERRRVVERLRRAGWAPVDGEANFVWLPLGGASQAFAQRCERSGVLVRPFPGDGVRVTIGLPAENDRFLAAAGTPTPRRRDPGGHRGRSAAAARGSL